MRILVHFLFHVESELSLTMMLPLAERGWRALDNQLLNGGMERANSFKKCLFLSTLALGLGAVSGQTTVWCELRWGPSQLSYLIRTVYFVKLINLGIRQAFFRRNHDAILSSVCGHT